MSNRASRVRIPLLPPDRCPEWFVTVRDFCFFAFKIKLIADFAVRNRSARFVNSQGADDGLDDGQYELEIQKIP